MSVKKTLKNRKTGLTDEELEAIKEYEHAERWLQLTEMTRPIKAAKLVFEIEQMQMMLKFLMLPEQEFQERWAGLTAEMKKNWARSNSSTFELLKTRAWWHNRFNKYNKDEIQALRDRRDQNMKEWKKAAEEKKQKAFEKKVARSKK